MVLKLYKWFVLVLVVVVEQVVMV
jgi:hypothetical protein